MLRGDGASMLVLVLNLILIRIRALIGCEREQRA
jgi:hypothetical protein